MVSLASPPPRPRRVSWAPAPPEVASKYATADGHPGHEGETAHAKRSLGYSWGHDLTPGNIEMLEKELGDAYQPSIVRLTRR